MYVTYLENRAKVATPTLVSLTARVVSEIKVELCYGT